MVLTSAACYLPLRLNNIDTNFYVMSVIVSPCFWNSMAYKAHSSTSSYLQIDPLWFVFKIIFKEHVLAYILFLTFTKNMMKIIFLGYKNIKVKQAWNQSLKMFSFFPFILNYSFLNKILVLYVHASWRTVTSVLQKILLFQMLHEILGNCGSPLFYCWLLVFSGIAQYPTFQYKLQNKV